jgi:hypothetical protein
MPAARYLAARRGRCGEELVLAIKPPLAACPRRNVYDRGPDRLTTARDRVPGFPTQARKSNPPLSARVVLFAGRQESACASDPFTSRAS